MTDQVRVQQFDDETWTVWLGNVRLTSFPSLPGAEECAEKVRQFAALQPSPAPVGEWREAVDALKGLRRAMNFRDAALCCDDPAILHDAVRQIIAADDLAQAVIAKADQISALGREGEQGTSVAESTDAPCSASSAAAEDGPCKSEEFRHWCEVVRDWSGSAFLSGEAVEDEGALKWALSGDLLRLGSFLMAWADAAATEGQGDLEGEI